MFLLVLLLVLQYGKWVTRVVSYKGFSVHNLCFKLALQSMCLHEIVKSQSLLAYILWPVNLSRKNESHTSCLFERTAHILNICPHDGSVQQGKNRTSSNTIFSCTACVTGRGRGGGVVINWKLLKYNIRHQRHTAESKDISDQWGGCMVCFSLKQSKKKTLKKQLSVSVYQAIWESVAGAIISRCDSIYFDSSLSSFVMPRRKGSTQDLSLCRPFLLRPPNPIHLHSLVKNFHWKLKNK